MSHFAFPCCHCEEALAEADVAIQSGSLCALPYAFAGLPRRAVALLAMTGCEEGEREGSISYKKLGQSSSSSSSASFMRCRKSPDLSGLLP
jgi:hypothetical protein